MTRRDLAEYLRNQANGLHLPLEDGTELTKSERLHLRVLMQQTEALAKEIEASNTADANALVGLGILGDAD